MTTLVWFRDDLRLADHPALRAALEKEGPVICLYVLDEESAGVRSLGGAARWWLHHSLEALADRVQDRGGTLVLRRGPAADVVPEVADAAGADAVFWNRRYGGAEREVDSSVKDTLRQAGIEAHSFAGSLLFEPWTITTGQGGHYKVFTPFWKACLAEPPPRAPLPEPREVPGPASPPASDDLDAWGLTPTAPDWAGGLREAWEPGELAARRRLRDFLEQDVDEYDRARDEPAAGTTSLLSPHLRFGEISPYTVWHEAVSSGRDVGGFLSEIGWREFAWHTLYHFPALARENLNARFDAFPWPELNEDHLRFWQQGRTGVALVDAGMRELWETGTMHNRVRMVVASYLVKNLMIDWRHGEEWFWDTLVDADEASNPFNWQWVAGSGADAAPYFRIFNPETQAKKFDPQHQYVGRWAPEYVSGDELLPEPLVDLRASRQQALDAYEEVKGASNERG
ncbi:cryptochrome/photolyase family protein [Zhihengliuella flava]|uniref:Deoxyribodipyrimidine photo-lyase n=1 Tax=Zhihengliuella flava TaxID=1285193 RepID=A0A931D9M8_9MICC|nr:deoxyribodipyrimidine photo-lyase [Zhihengliuella flava]MBG6084568.1 deoxyribodipyrimidine photo-lyase [Zhihengliuella flava]